MLISKPLEDASKQMKINLKRNELVIHRYFITKVMSVFATNLKGAKLTESLDDLNFFYWVKYSTLEIQEIIFKNSFDIDNHIGIVE